jgi:hypothetical protein
MAQYQTVLPHLLFLLLRLQQSVMLLQLQLLHVVQCLAIERRSKKPSPPRSVHIAHAARLSYCMSPRVVRAMRAVKLFFSTQKNAA